MHCAWHMQTWHTAHAPELGGQHSSNLSLHRESKSCGEPCKKKANEKKKTIAGAQTRVLKLKAAPKLFWPAACFSFNVWWVRDLVRCLVLKLCQQIRLYGNLQWNTIIASHSNTEVVGGRIGCWVSHRGSWHNLGNIYRYIRFLDLIVGEKQVCFEGES